MPGFLAYCLGVIRGYLGDMDMMGVGMVGVWLWFRDRCMGILWGCGGYFLLGC